MTPIIFDIDGTLADTKAVDDKCFIEAFREVFKVDLAQQDWSVLQNVTDWGITEEIIQNHFNRLPTPLEYQQMKSRLFVRLAEELEQDRRQYQPVDGAIDFVAFLQKETEHPLGIATGAWEQSALTKLKGIGLEHRDLAFSNSDYHKNRADIMMDVIQQLKGSGSMSEVLYFGDGLWDYTTCMDLGVRFIGIDLLGDGQLKQAGAEFVFRDFLDRDGIMRIINN